MICLEMPLVIGYRRVPDPPASTMPLTAGKSIQSSAIGAVIALAALCGAGGADASTKWLCGPGVADDPCRPSLSTTVYRGWAERTGTVTPKRSRGADCFYV